MTRTRARRGVPFVYLTDAAWEYNATIASWVYPWTNILPSFLLVVETSYCLIERQRKRGILSRVLSSPHPFKYWHPCNVHKIGCCWVALVVRNWFDIPLGWERLYKSMGAVLPSYCPLQIERSTHPTATCRLSPRRHQVWKLLASE